MAIPDLLGKLKGKGIFLLSTGTRGGNALVRVPKISSLVRVMMSPMYRNRIPPFGSTTMEERSSILKKSLKRVF